MNSYFEDDEVFQDVEGYYKHLMDRMFKEMREFEKAVAAGRLKGNWAIKPIERPGVRGYVARGSFQLNREPTHIPRRAFEEKREPLTDVFEEKEQIKVYIELPGVEKDDIQLNVTDRHVEVKAKNFFKKVALPSHNVGFEAATAAYKNGVLEVTIPKTKTAVESHSHTIKIE